MATKSDGKGGINPQSWNKHMKDGKKFHNRRVRQNGKRKIESAKNDLEQDKKP